MGTGLSVTILEISFMHAYWDTLTEEIMGVQSLKVNQSNS